MWNFIFSKWREYSFDIYKNTKSGRFKLRLLRSPKGLTLVFTASALASRSAPQSFFEAQAVKMQALPLFAAALDTIELFQRFTFSSAMPVKNWCLKFSVCRTSTPHTSQKMGDVVKRSFFFLTSFLCYLALKVGI